MIPTPPRLAALVLAGSMLCPLSASAGSLLKLGPEQVAAAASGRSTVAIGLRGAPNDPAACARDFHARLKPIAEGPFQKVKAALGAPAEATGGSGAAEGGGMIFPPNARSRGPNETAALRAAMAVAKGATGVAPRDANARWTALRIREDLADFLTQGPSPYLCSGIDPYLATLKRFAGQVSVSPDRRQRDLDTARAMARASLDDALLALRPVPVPTSAPERAAPVADMAADALRPGGTEAASETVIGPPMLVAGREASASEAAETRISAGDLPDPDLPPLVVKPENKLESAADIGAAVAELDAAIRRTMPALAGTSATIDATTTGSVTSPIGPMRPAAASAASTAAPSAPQKGALEQLSALKPLFAPDGGFTADPRTRVAVLGALSDLEAADRLLEAKNLPEDPLGAAFTETFAAIETAHAESCRCKP